MSDLRLILLLIGVGVIAGVYAWTRFQQSSRSSAVRASSVAAAPRTPLDEPDEEAVQAQLARMEQLVATRDGEPDDEPDIGTDDGPPDTSVAERLLVISIVAGEGESFAGDVLHKAFRHNKLHFSERGIYERRVLRDGRELSLFGIANLVKPGTFEAGDMAGFSTPGITLFLQLPCAIAAVEAFDDFVKTAERLAVEIGGELRDEHHAVLSHQTLMQVRESIVAARSYPGVAS